MNRKHKVLLKFRDILCYNVSGSIARRNILRKRKSVMKVIFIVIVAVLIVLFIISIYHQIHLKKEAELRLPLGQLVEVDGHNMSIYVEGTGDTTLVFLSGGGTCSPILDAFLSKQTVQTGAENNTSWEVLE